MDVEEIHKEHASIMRLEIRAKVRMLLIRHFGQICMDTMLMTKN